MNTNASYPDPNQMPAVRVGWASCLLGWHPLDTHWMPGVEEEKVWRAGMGTLGGVSGLEELKSGSVRTEEGGWVGGGRFMGGVPG